MYALALVLLLLAIAGDEPASAPAILEPGGQFADEEAPPLTGWLGLTNERHPQLVPATIEYAREGPVEEWVDVRTDPPGLRYLFRNIPELKPGPVVEAEFSEVDKPELRDAVMPSTELYRIGERSWTLRVEVDDDSGRNMTVTLVSGEVSQVLFRLDGDGDEPHADVWWAGDLDHDGLLDFVGDFSWKYSYHPTTLYLSSRAKAGELVGAVAVHEGGC